MTISISDAHPDQQKQAAELTKVTHNVDLKENNMEGDAEVHVPTNIEPFIRADNKSGLTREELLRYSDDPFWVRLRWATFGFFWLVWIALLVSAITLIVTAPRCPVTGNGSDYATNCVYVELRVDSTKTTHDWFQRSERGEPTYAEYYVWGNDTDAATPPANKDWKWTKSETRKSYYLSDAENSEEAILNLSNPDVSKNVAEWLLQWVDAGAGGVRLLKTNKWYTREVKTKNDSLAEEEDGRVGLMRGWRDQLHERDAMLTVTEDALSQGRGLAGAVDLPPAPTVKLNTNLDSIRQDMELWSSFNDTYPSIKVVDQEADVELMFALMLPAVPIFTWDQMNTYINNNETAAVYNKTMDIREEIQEAEYKFDVIAVQYIIAFSRWKEGRGYVMAAHNVAEASNINLTSLRPATLPHQLQAVIFSKRYNDEFTDKTISKPMAMTDKLGMTNPSGIILKF